MQSHICYPLWFPFQSPPPLSPSSDNYRVDFILFIAFVMSIFSYYNKKLCSVICFLVINIYMYGFIFLFSGIVFLIHQRGGGGVGRRDPDVFKM